MYHKPYTRSALLKYSEVINGLQIIESGFLPFGFRSLILDMVRSRSIEKAVYFLYHAVWRALNLVFKMFSDDYQNPIYLIAKRIK